MTVGPSAWFRRLLMVLGLSPLVGGKTAKTQAFAGQDRAHFGRLGIEKRRQAAADVDIGAAVADADVKGKVAGRRGDGHMRGVRHDGYGKSGIVDGAVDELAGLFGGRESRSIDG